MLGLYFTVTFWVRVDI